MTESPDNFIHPSAVIDDGVNIGIGSKIWHFSHLLSGTDVGKRCTIGQNVMIGPNVSVGDNCKIQNNVSLYSGTTIERDVFIGPSAVFTNVLTPRAFIERKSEFKKTIVKSGASIGANATILCGITLGEFCLVGAGAVVTSSVQAHALMVGNPARQIGWVSISGHVLDENMICPYDGTKYVVKDGKIQLLT